MGPCNCPLVKKVGRVKRDQELPLRMRQQVVALAVQVLDEFFYFRNKCGAMLRILCCFSIPTDDKHGFSWLLFNAILFHLFPENNVQNAFPFLPNDLSKSRTYPAHRRYLTQQKSGPTCQHPYFLKALGDQIEHG